MLLTAQMVGNEPLEIIIRKQKKPCVMWRRAFGRSIFEVITFLFFETA